MNTKMKLITVGVTCVLGIGAGFAFACAGTGEDLHYPPQMLQEMASPRDLTPELPVYGTDAALIPAFIDEGDSHDIATIKSIIPLILTDWTAAGELDGATNLPNEDNQNISESQRLVHLELNHSLE